MAFNGMPQIPSVSQGQVAITATQFSSFATPAITVPFPSVYAGQTQIPFTFTATPTWAATRVPTTVGGQAATAGVHSINSQASAAGYRTHDYGNNGGGSGWPVWATAVIASAGGIAVILVVAGLFCWRHRKRQKVRRRNAALAAAQGRRGFTERKRQYGQPGAGARNGAATAGAGVVGAAALGEKSRRSHRPPTVDTSGPGGRPSAYGQGYPAQPYSDSAAPGQQHPSRYDQPITPTRPASFAQQQQHPPPPGAGGFPAYVPFRNHVRDGSAGSDAGLLPPAAGFAYMENSPDQAAGWVTPPRRAPNDYGDSPQSPAHLLVNDGGAVAGYGDTPRSSMTVSTRGTGGAPYRWDHDPDLAEHMPNPEEASAALGRAMLGGYGEQYHPLSGGGASNPVTPERHHLPTGYRASGDYGGGGGGGGGGGTGSMALAAAYGRASSPSYPPPVSRPNSRGGSRPRSAPRDSLSAAERTYDGRGPVTPTTSSARRSLDGGAEEGGARAGSSRSSSQPRTGHHHHSASNPNPNRISLAPPIALGEPLSRRSLDMQSSNGGRRSLDAPRRPASRTSTHRRSAYDPDDVSVYSSDDAQRGSTPTPLQQAANLIGRRPSRSYRPPQ
ncbi:hypothetical protein JCM10908_006038 [Rhodotorula pacifica]|uniref:uncharacterized protein n=1 Tax=Rhodotorula pacifica TaxID=1495444 RepID=UPI003170B77B